MNLGTREVGMCLSKGKPLAQVRSTKAESGFILLHGNSTQVAETEGKESHEDKLVVIVSHPDLWH